MVLNACCIRFLLGFRVGRAGETREAENPELGYSGFPLPKKQIRPPE